MGADVIIQLNSDGTSEQVSYGYHLYKDYGDLQIIADQQLHFFLGGNNLTVKYGDGEYQPAGDPDYFYGSVIEITKGRISASHTSDLYRKGDNIYILACDMTKDEGSSGIYEVNLKTSEITCMVDSSVSRFIIEGEYIYYFNSGIENQVKRLQLSSGEVVPIAGPYKDSRITDIAVLNKNVYFTMITDFHG